MELCLDKSALLREILISGKRPFHTPWGLGMCDQAMVKNQEHTHTHT